jgi:hypothetical protein
MILVIVRLLSLHRDPDLFEQRLKEPKQIDFHVRRPASGVRLVGGGSMASNRSGASRLVAIRIGRLLRPGIGLQTA